MRELFFKLFEMSHFNTGIKITPFSLSHIVYMILIFGGIIAAWLIFRKKDAAAKEKVLRFLTYTLALSYFSDFFVHEFVYGGLNTDKLPFHICTVLCLFVAYTQFNLKGGWLREPVAVLATIAPMMYLCFPASVGEGEPWCYQAVQTMFFHGILMAWGILTIALGAAKPNIRHSWKCAALLGFITVWAKLGNLLMDHNWFFLEEDALYIGLVSGGIIPKWSLMIINPTVYFLAVLLVYAACAIIDNACRKSAAKA